jgi:hypothetical protein
MASSWESLQAQPTDTEHPAEMDERSFARRTELIRAGIKSPYELGLDDIHLPPSAISGRVQHAGFFTGKIDTVTGKLRVDHSVDHAFWLQVDLLPLVQAYLAHKFRPGGPESMELHADWQAQVTSNEAARDPDMTAHTAEFK